MFWFNKILELLKILGVQLVDRQPIQIKLHNSYSLYSHHSSSLTVHLDLTEISVSATADDTNQLILTKPKPVRETWRWGQRDLRALPHYRNHTYQHFKTVIHLRMQTTKISWYWSRMSTSYTPQGGTIGLVYETGKECPEV